jgi:short-subunit dehydrogenase
VPDQADQLARHAGEVDILIANAALPASGALDSFTVNEIDRALDVNLRAPILLAKQLSPAMVTRGRGHLLFTSSLLGKFPSPSSSVYCATKFGLRGFSGSLRNDLHGTGVGVSVVFPGIIRDAGMFADAKVDVPGGVGTSSPDDVARGVVRAIERNRGEVVVAPVAQRLLGALGAVSPGWFSGISRLAGTDKVTAKVAEGQRDKR